MARAIRGASIAALLILSLAGCAGTPARTARPGPDWSRGIHVGECSVNGTIALHVEPDGSTVHLAWPETTAEGDRIHYVQLDSQARPKVARVLPLSARSPLQVRLLPDGAGGLVLCYLSGIGEDRRLYAAHLDATGALLSEPEQVSQVDLAVSEYAARATDKGIHVFWSNNDYHTRGIYHLLLDSTGHVIAPSKLVVDKGISPDFQADRSGRLHLTWVYEPTVDDENILYAPFDAGTREAGGATLLGRFALPRAATRFGPVVGLGRDTVHVVWAWEHLASGATTTAGEAECRYASFPIDNPAAARESALSLPPTPRPGYALANGAFAYTALASFGVGSSSVVCMPGFVPGQRDEAALAVCYAVSTRSGSGMRVAVVYLEGAAPKGYQIAAAAGSVVMRPALAADGTGQLHLVWLEPGGFHQYLVYYASTSPAVRAALGRPGYDDVVAAAYGVTMLLARALSMFPIAIVWLFLPFVWLILYLFARIEGDLSRRGPRIALAVAIAIYIVAKFFIFPSGFLGAAPLADRLPPTLAGVYLIALPAAILAIAGVTLWLYTRRREGATLLLAYLVFGLTDSVLTFLIYAQGVLG